MYAHFRWHICVFALFFLVTKSVYAQEDKIDYNQHLTISEGLAHNGVTSIFEDSKGFLWFGTYDGLNKYDGFQLKTFKNQIGDKVLVSNRVREIKEDGRGNIWIGTDEGISLYNRETNKFISLYSNQLTKRGNKGPIIRDIEINLKAGIVLCATKGAGLILFNEDYSFRKQYIPPQEQFGKQIEFFSGIALNENYYVYSTSEGLIGFDLNKEKFQKILSNQIDFSRSLVLVDEQTLVVALGQGVVLIKYATIENIPSFEIISDTILPNYNFGSLIVDNLDHLWLGTLNDGAIKIDNIKGISSKNLKEQIKFKPEAGLLRVSGFLSTTNSGFWISTFNKGLYRVDLSNNPFKEFSGALKYDFGINNKHIRHITPFGSDRVYLTKNTGGLALFNTATDSFEPLPFTLPQNSLSGVSAIFVDSKKNTFLKIRGKGYFRLPAGKKKLQPLDSSSLPSFENSIPYKITEDKFGNIWLGCRNNVYRLKLTPTGEVEKIEALNDNPFFKNNKLSLIRYVYSDPLYDFIWLGTANDGLIRLHLNENDALKDIEIDQYRNTKVKGSLPNNFVSSIARSEKGDLWIGTEGAGICKVTKCNEEPEFTTYSEKQGLSNNVVKSILFDGDSNLWAMTNIGLNKFYTSTQNIRSFGKRDGLPFEDFWYTALRLENGFFMLTGLEGFCYFNPKDIADKEALPKLQFGNLKIFNRTIKINDTIQDRILLNHALIDSDTLKLKYDENVFSVEALALHFSAVDNHFLRYRLDPIDKDWIEVPSDQRQINYNGLQPGEYKLELAASNSIKDWTDAKVLHIVISPPFWKTPWAYFFYVLTTVLILGTILFYILKTQNLRHNIQLEQVEKNKTKEVNDAKLRFFANISHELKTPLNLITSPVRILSERYKGNNDVEEKLNIIQRQSRKITHLIDQVHDFERVDANLVEMNYSRFYFDFFLEDLLIDFKFLADNNNRNLDVIGRDSNIVVSADRDKLEKVFNNLLSNAFKYTNEKDSITIEYESNEKDLIVSVRDTGKGIDSEDLPHIFERFYQSHNKDNKHSTGSGIGLAFSKRLIEMHYGYIEAESELAKGTTICVRLPIVKKESASDQERREQTILLAENEFSIESQLTLKVDTAQVKASGDYSENLIFYAEDNSDMRQYVSQFLSKFYKVKTFNDGQECLDAMGDEWPDLLISDIQMPDLNGLELCKRVKSDMATSHIPIILLTALANIDDHIRGIRDGADAYINKPFDVRQLIARIEGLLENRKRLRDRFEVGIPLTYDNNINNRNDNAFLEKLYNLMAENLDNQDLDIDQFARKLYLNRTHFYQKVKALSNHTPFELLKMYRLKKAAELLAEKKFSVNEVYVMTGFKSRTHFSKLFKEKFSISPGKYNPKNTI